MEKIRIQKYLSDAGICSRRAAEALVADGKITVNLRPCEIGQKVSDDDVIICDGKRVSRQPGGKKVYIMLNKPRGYVTTNHDESGRDCVADLVADVGVRVYPVGRLDRESEGLLLLTNDGEFANTLTHPSHMIPKIYNVKVRGFLTEQQFSALRAPMLIDGYEIKPVQVDVIGEGEDSTLLRFRLYEGRNRQIRKMCETVRIHVMRLTRVAIGDIAIGNLKPGKWQPLTQAQIGYLMGQAEQ